MLRRRRPRKKEIEFSFDSFLDLVANVVGVILRLILVAWVGARTYTGVFKPPEDSVPAEASAPAEPALSTDAEKAALDQARRQLADARAALLEHLRRQEDARSHTRKLNSEVAAVAGQVETVRIQAASVEGKRRQAVEEHQRVELSLAEIRQRGEELARELADLKKQPVVKKVLRYQTPVARTVQSDELHFEIRAGRVTFLDVEALVREIRQGLQSKGEVLKTQWQVRDETGPVGAFRMRYVISRERGLIDSVTGAGRPDNRSEFRFGVEGWEAVPVADPRGEPLAQTLAAGSEFRRLIDRLDATHTAVTFWVYPDSFPAYRQVRDYCLKRDLLVSGRPLPNGASIASSRQGTASRGQ